MSREQSPSPEQEAAGEETKRRITHLARILNDEWRRPRWREESQDYEPKLKKTEDQVWSQAHGGATEVDIANTDYEVLPRDWQEDNRASAEAAVTEVEKAKQAGVPINEAFVEGASAVVHDKFLERRGSAVPSEQDRLYTKLSEEEKDKDRVIIRRAIEICGG